MINNGTDSPLGQGVPNKASNSCTRISQHPLLVNDGPYSNTRSRTRPGEASELTQSDQGCRRVENRQGAFCQHLYQSNYALQQRVNTPLSGPMQANNNLRSARVDLSIHTTLQTMTASLMVQVGQSMSGRKMPLNHAAGLNVAA